MQFRSFAFASVIAAVAAAPALAAPEVTPPEDFADAGQLRAALKEMHGYVREQEKQTGSWRARRAAGICGDGLRRLEDYRTSMAYDAEVGKRLWQDCHDAYDDVE